MGLNTIHYNKNLTNQIHRVNAKNCGICYEYYHLSFEIDDDLDPFKWSMNYKLEFSIDDGIKWNEMFRRKI